MARLEAENWRGTRYRDFLLLPVGDAWRIASQVFSRIRALKSIGKE